MDQFPERHKLLKLTQETDIYFKKLNLIKKHLTKKTSDWDGFARQFYQTFEVGIISIRYNLFPKTKEV